MVPESSDSRDGEGQKAEGPGWLPIGIGVGLALGVAIGAAIGSVGAGIGIGLALGAGVAIGLDALRRRRTSNDL